MLKCLVYLIHFKPGRLFFDMNYNHQGVSTKQCFQQEKRKNLLSVFHLGRAKLLELKHTFFFFFFIKAKQISVSGR